MRRKGICLLEKCSKLAQMEKKINVCSCVTDERRMEEVVVLNKKRVEIIYPYFDCLASVKVPLHQTQTLTT